MNWDEEPKIAVHLTQAVTEDGEAIAAGFYNVYLCVAIGWFGEGAAHLCCDVSEVDQAAIVMWVNRCGLTLGRLEKEVSISKAMLSQVMHGKKKLSNDKFIAVLDAYSRFCHVTRGVD
jgi:hypothetical protein